MQTAKDVQATIKDNDVQQVDAAQHVTFDVSEVGEDRFGDGIMFEGSSFGGRTSDMPMTARWTRSSRRPP